MMLAMMGRVIRRTSRSCEGHDEYIAEYRDCDDTRHYTFCKIAPEHCAEEDGRHVQFAIGLDQRRVCDSTCDKAGIELVQ